MNRLYAAYGSNLNIKQMGFRCPDAKIVAKSWLHDYRLVFQGYTFGAHANVIPDKGQEVPIVIWEISQQDERALDRYEGVKGGYYTKKYLQVEVAGEMKEVLIYIMTPNGFGIPADSYLHTIEVGYKNFNLPVATLNEALIYSYDKIHTQRRLRNGKKHSIS